MTLSKNKILFECSCGYAHDIYLEQNNPISTVCINCDTKWYILLNAFSLSPKQENKED